MMQIDEKFVLFCSVSVVLISSYFAWPLFFLYITILTIIYYDFSPQTDTLQGHGINKVKKLLSKVKHLATHTFSWPNVQLRLEQDYYTPNMYPQNAWEPKRHSNSGLFTPIPRCGSRINVAGKITSTPKSPSWRASEFANNITPVKPSRIQRPERYSLSDISYNSPQNDSPHQQSPRSIQNAAGPLLASSRYNIGMGLYADTKSPGLASRIVQYNSDYDSNSDSSFNRRDKLTHLPKYSSPGQFPVVNLVKTPLRHVKPKSVTVRIAPPDHTPYSAIDRSMFLNESVQDLQRASSRLSSSSTEISTRSVLDALREISRKRLHARDDSSIDTSKRQRKDSFSTQSSDNELPVSSKRNREHYLSRNDSINTSTSSSPSPKKQKQKCNDLLSSLSSSVHLRQQYTTKRKAEMAGQSPDTNKQIKLGTDNTANKSPENAQSIPQSKNQLENDEDELMPADVEVLYERQQNKREVTPPPDELDNYPVIKKINEGSIVNENGVCRLTFITNPPEKETDVFIPFKPPTENSKRKRLAALLGALSGEGGDIKTLTEKFFPCEKKSVDVPDSLSPKSLVGILCPAGSKLDTVKKHVTFNIPDSAAVTTVNTNTESVPSLFPTSQSSENIQIQSNVETTTLNNQSQTPLATTRSNLVFESPTTKSENAVTPKNSESSLNPVPPTFNTAESTILIATEISVSKTSSLPQIQTTYASSVQNTPPTVSTFSFGVGKPICSTSFSTSITPVASSTSSTNSSTVSFTNVKPTMSQNPSSTSYNFGTTSPSTNTSIANINSSKLQFGNPATTIQQESSTAVKATGGFHYDIKTSATTASFGTSVSNTVSQSVPAKTNPSFTFANNSKSFTTEALPLKSTFAAPFGTAAFNTNSNEISSATVTSTVTPVTPATGGFSFSKIEPKIETTTSEQFGFNSNTINKPSTTPFGSSVSNFGTSPLPAFSSVNSSNGFGANTANTPSTNNAFGQTSTGGTFKTPSTSATFEQSSSNLPVFGASTTTGSFGQTSTASMSFAQTSKPTFGQSSNSLSTFGQPSTTSPPTFGPPATTSTPTFGQPTTSTPTFGQTTTSTSNIFGQTSTTTGSSIFGQAVITATASFVTTAAPVATFGSVTNVFNSTPSPFGSSATIDKPMATFGSTFGAFGATSTAPPTFGAPTQPTNTGFGTSTTVAPVFGTPATNVFGSAGASKPSFGGTAPNSFTGTNTPSTNMFASSTTSSNQNTAVLFGTSNQANSFGTNTFDTSVKTTPPAFSGFGVTTTTQPQSNTATTSGIFSFGNQNNGPTNTNNAFQFGGNTSKPAPGGFNFSAGSSTTPAFGSSTPAFGATATPAFSSTPAQFGTAPQQGGNMFSIGTGSTAPRPRAAARLRKK